MLDMSSYAISFPLDPCSHVATHSTPPPSRIIGMVSMELTGTDTATTTPLCAPWRVARDDLAITRH